MPEVSQTDAASGAVNAATGTGAETAAVTVDNADSTKSGEVDSLRQALNPDSFATKAEIAVLRRETGHIRGVQKELAEIKKGLQEPQSDARYDSLAERFETLIEGISSLLDPTVAAKLKPADRGILSEVEALLDKRLPKPEQATEKTGDAEEVDPEVLKQAYLMDAMWTAAGGQVTEYAKSKGIDISDWDTAKWEDAQKATFDKASPFGDPYKGAKVLMSEIDKRAEVAGRRTDRADAASGGLPNDRGGAQAGSLTREAMLDMTAEQLMKIPRAERDAALRGSAA